ncbi:uncharacterized protein LOC107981265 isoform X6 [Nasonia vitripennis]|uniref:Uncharacterized protein n=1 Tax=Nasonia vitripennis TaxID=7425 RepID=A0A7M7PUC9_NASVI|nr:uncharacterized protein LOC107981265 isoform X6 [Nasonia vitripennis]
MVCTIIGFLRTVLWKRRSHILDLFIPEERDKDSLCHKRKEAIEVIIFVLRTKNLKKC